MKILFVAGNSAYNRHVFDALRANGNEVVFMNSRQDYSLPGFLGSSRSLWRLSRKIPFLRRRAKQAFQEHLRYTVASFVPRTLLAIKGMEFKPDMIAGLQKKGIKMVCWFPENAANEPYTTWVRTVGPAWDHFLSFDSAILDQMPIDGRARVGVLSFGASPEGFETEPLTEEDEKKYSCDVAFIGAPYSDRVKLLERVTNIDLRIWGWEGWKKTSLARYWRGPLDARESGKVYRLAKISVNTNVAPLTNGANCRTYEIPAAGGFQLSDEPSDLSKSFIIGSELDTFHSDKEFESKVRYWLAHDDKRSAVARAGKQRLLKDHTLRARMRTLIDMISS